MEPLWFLLVLAVGCSPHVESASNVNFDVTDWNVRPQEVSEGWPCLYGPSHMGVSRETGLDLKWGTAEPRVLWRVPIGNGYSAPVIEQGRVIVLHRQGDEEVVQAFATDDGRSLWQHRSPTGYVCPYDYSSGPYSTPVIHDGCVYTIGAEARMHCLRCHDGSVVWSRDLADDYDIEPSLFAVGGSPLVEADRLIFNLGARIDYAGIAAFDPGTGTTVWTTTDDGPGYATPIAATMHGRRLVFVVTYDGLACVDPDSGHLEWKVPFRPRKHLSVNATSPVVIDDLVLMSTGPGTGTVCLRVLENGYEEVWRDRRVLDSQFNNLVIVERHLFGFTSSRQGGAMFRCIDPKSGELNWELHSPVERGTALAVDGHIILLGEYGHLGAMPIQVDVTPPLNVTPNPVLAAPSYSAPALAAGHLYLRNERELTCIDLRSTDHR